MKTNPWTIQSIRRLALAGLMAGIVGGTSGYAQAAEDEWYDPSDWFDGNNIEADDTYDYASYDYDYDYGFDDTYDYGSDWADFDTWDYDAGYYDADYWDDYSWYDNYDLIDDDFVDTYTYTVFASPADNQQSGTQQQSGSNRANRQNAEEKKQSVAKLTGTVQGLRNMRLKQASGATGTYTIANIRLENGKNAIVNLGRSSGLDDVDLKKGDSIQALGRRGAVSGKSVFVAHKLKTDGQTIDANPVIRLSDRQMAQQQNQKMVKGTVAEVNKSSGKNNHTLLSLQLQNGQSATVDLGPAASLDKIDLQPGEEVTVRGYTKQMNGRQVLIPNLMKVEGEKVSVAAE